MNNTELIDRLSSQWNALDPVDEWRLDITEAIRTIEAQALKIEADKHSQSDYLKMLAEADARIESLRADAARYRWLLEKAGFGIRRNGVHELSFAFYVKQPNHIDELSACIDAALQSSKDAKP